VHVFLDSTFGQSALWKNLQTHYVDNMAARVSVTDVDVDVDSSSSSSSSSSTSSLTSKPKYWSAENHTNYGNTYLRAEEWLKDLAPFTLPGERRSIQLTKDMGIAILRYREELKMYAAIEDQQNPQRTIDALDDVAFLDRRHAAMRVEWPQGRERAVWWSSLTRLMELVDAEIRSLPSRAAFVKLSVRSPKDAASRTASFRQQISRHVEASDVRPDSPLALSDDCRAIRLAHWRSTLCRSGEDALLLFVRSDRIYLDVLQHDLFSGDHFDLKVHVSEFFELDPDYEFRGFVSKGVRTALTIYSPFVFSERMLRDRDRILALINALWDRVSPLIRSQDYSLDFVRNRSEREREREGGGGLLLRTTLFLYRLLRLIFRRCGSSSSTIFSLRLPVAVCSLTRTRRIAKCCLRDRSSSDFATNRWSPAIFGASTSTSAAASAPSST
jgi:hypothetical protein